MVRAKASGTIAFGLVSIPVQFYTAASKQRVEFNMIHAKCGGRMEQKMWCPVDSEYVERADMIRGWERTPEQYVLFTDAELQSLKGPRSTAIELVEFVPEDVRPGRQRGDDILLLRVHGGRGRVHAAWQCLPRKRAAVVLPGGARASPQLHAVRRLAATLVLPMRLRRLVLAAAIAGVASIAMEPFEQPVPVVKSCGDGERLVPATHATGAVVLDSSFTATPITADLKLSDRHHCLFRPTAPGNYKNKDPVPVEEVDDKHKDDAEACNHNRKGDVFDWMSAPAGSAPTAIAAKDFKRGVPAHCERGTAADAGRD